MTRLTSRNVGIVLLVLLAATVGATAPAVADHTEDGDEFLGGVLSDNSSTWTSAKAAASGAQAKVGHILSDSGETDAAAIEEGVRTYFNSDGRAGEFQSYINNRTTADETALAITYKPNGEDGKSATHYVTADVVDGEYRNASVVSSYDGEPDEECTLRNAAARNAESELKTFYEEYVTADKDVTTEYLITKRVEYSGQVSCTFLNGGGE